MKIFVHNRFVASACIDAKYRTIFDCYSDSYHRVYFPKTYFFLDTHRLENGRSSSLNFSAIHLLEDNFNSECLYLPYNNFWFFDAIPAVCLGDDFPKYNVVYNLGDYLLSLINYFYSSSFKIIDDIDLWKKGNIQELSRSVFKKMYSENESYRYNLGNIVDKFRIDREEFKAIYNIL